MFQKKAPKGVEPSPDDDLDVAPVTEVKKPKKAKKKKAKKHVPKEGQKGKIAEMLKGNYCAKDSEFEGGNVAPANKVPSGFGRKGASQFVPEQKRFGI